MKNYELFSELAHPGRIQLLFMLNEQAMRLTDISKKLDMSTPETSRHLERLVNSSLIEKNIDGMYKISTFGKLMLTFTPMVDFLVKNADFLSIHDLSPLPIEFIQRIGELSKVNIGHIKGTMHWFHIMEKCFSEANEYILAMANEYLMSASPIIQKRVNDGVEFRIIIPHSYIPPSDYKPIKGLDVGYRTIDDVKVGLVITEKSAGAAFLDMDGKFDYTNIIGEQEAPPSAHKWTKDLFEYYWEKAKPLTF